jgi:8-oxo-dGTP diphosphatase
MKQVAAAIIFNKGKILVTRRAPGEKLAGYWEFPGGKLEGNETPQECIIRELREELGLHAAAGDVIASSVYEYTGGAIELIAVECTVRNYEISLSVHDAYEYIQPEALLDIRLAPADIDIAKKILKQPSLTADLS